MSVTVALTSRPVPAARPQFPGCDCTDQAELWVECGGGWGTAVLVLLLGGGGMYVGGGVAIGRKAGRVGTPGGSALSAHPHWQQWIELSGLVKDGIKFSQGGGGPGGRVHMRVDAEGGRQSGRQSGREEGSPKGRSSASSEKAGKGKKEKAKKAKNEKSGGKSELKEPLSPAEPPAPPAAVERVWKPTRSALQQGARETGVKVGDHVPGQGLL